MTYRDVMIKAQALFDPEHRGIITGHPVEVLFCISREADDRGWENKVNATALLDRLSQKTHLDKGSVDAVIGIVSGT